MYTAERPQFPPFVAVCTLFLDAPDALTVCAAALGKLEQAVFARYHSAQSVDVSWTVARALFAAATVGTAAITHTSVHGGEIRTDRPLSFDEAERLLEALVHEQSSLCNFPDATGVRPFTAALERAMERAPNRILALADALRAHEVRYGRDDVFLHHEQSLERLLTQWRLPV